jgi:predicted flap endonuclease-1-like 5' DNA nuclease
MRLVWDGVIPIPYQEKDPIGGTMKVKAQKSFVARIDGVVIRAEVGEVVEMPAGADWVRAGLAVEEKGTSEMKSPPKRGLTDIRGIGVDTVISLAGVGVVTFEELAAADPMMLSTLKDVSLRKAKKWVLDAADFVVEK